jgi:FkbM family methyltransferase
VKFLKYNLYFWDFVPPILVRPIKKIRSFLKLSKDSISFQPFISPILNSYSQFNEDLLLDLFLGSKKNGFYLDIGANDPSFNSNTKRFYDKGWFGINIEPVMEAFNKFCENRTRDINLNIGVGPLRGTFPFYKVVGDSTLSSSDIKIANKMARKFGLTVDEIEIEVMRLMDIFDIYIQDNQVDFMSVDAEGLDLEILQSNDWNRYRPTLVLVEIDNQYYGIIEYMKSCDYLLIYNNYHNGIFVDKNTSEDSFRAILGS